MSKTPYHWQILQRAVLAAALLPMASIAQADIPPRFQAVFFLKILKFDRNLNRFASPIKVGFLYRTDSEDSLTYKERTFPIFQQQVMKKKLRELSFTVDAIDVHTMPLSEITATYQILYLGPDLAATNEELQANHSGIATFTADREMLNQGTTFGIKLVAGKPRIVVRKTLSEKAHIAFDPRLLKLSQIID